MFSSVQSIIRIRSSLSLAERFKPLKRRKYVKRARKPLIQWSCHVRRSPDVREDAVVVAAQCGEALEAERVKGEDLREIDIFRDELRLYLRDEHSAVTGRIVCRVEVSGRDIDHHPILKPEAEAVDRAGAADAVAEDELGGHLVVGMGDDRRVILGGVRVAYEMNEGLSGKIRVFYEWITESFNVPVYFKGDCFLTIIP